ncbi:RNA polymerase sigma24 factor [Rhizocola hellebori]|uniref:RNA polymerase sigma24 factor n=1 Tax=Rhizocola hellebori TaxID=1392758 RepID=A0A8J3QKG1_9ACTN|nr:SigE family RNA polymerase sigma factor [Rhizocola hellebori]GIH11048.1 RNA polymerase sigma24 factor [Rhizocola hellebori]
MRSEAIDESDRLYTEYITTQLGQLRRLAIVLCQDSHRADDLVQEAITKLYTRWHRRHAIDHLDRYLRSILVREFLDSQRVGWMRRVRLAAESPEMVSPQADSVEDRMVVRALLGQMPARQRAVVVLRFMCDLPVDEVAEILGCSEGTVKSQTSAGLVTLRRHVGGVSDGAPSPRSVAVRS